MSTTTATKPKRTTKRTSVPKSEPATISKTAAAAILGEDHAADRDRILHLDPRSLTLDENARKDVGMTAAFAADIAEKGVTVPLLAYRDAVGQLLVWDGQRRLVAAVEAGLDTVPVVVTQPFGDGEERLATQDRVNHHRAGLTVVDQVAVYEQLSLMGRSADSIAKKLNRPGTEVKAALAVTSSKAAKKAAATPGVTLEQAAIIAEFDGDPEAVEELTRTLEHNPSGLEHTAQQIRDDRAREVEKRAKVAELEAAGLRVIPQPSYTEKKIERIDGLAAKPGGSALTPTTHADCPGHCVAVATTYRGEVVTTYYCDQWRKAGHVERHARAEKQELQADADKAREERRKVVERNKMSDASTEVRRRWVISLLQSKQLPKDAPQAIAELLVQTNHDSYYGHQARDLLLGSKNPTPQQLGQSATAATAWLLAEAFSQIEGGMYGSHARDYWRSQNAARVAYLKRLQSWGYPLSTLEAAYVANRVGEL